MREFFEKSNGPLSKFVRALALSIPLMGAPLSASAREEPPLRISDTATPIEVFKQLSAFAKTSNPREAYTVTACAPGGACATSYKLGSVGFVGHGDGRLVDAQAALRMASGGDIDYVIVAHQHNAERGAHFFGGRTNGLFVEVNTDKTLSGPSGSGDCSVNFWDFLGGSLKSRNIKVVKAVVDAAGVWLCRHTGNEFTPEQQRQLNNARQKLFQDSQKPGADTEKAVREFEVTASRLYGTNIVFLKVNASRSEFDQAIERVYNPGLAHGKGLLDQEDDARKKPGMFD